jgi:DNA-binding MarR family transcriptional regulator
MILSLMASDLELVLGALTRIHTGCRPRALPVAEGATVSPHQARLLGHLDREDPAMVTELAESLGVTPSTMSLTLGRLERAGLVTRQRDPEDRRVMNVRLTDEGERIRETARPFDADNVDAALLRLRPGERREAVRGLALLADAVESGS